MLLRQDVTAAELVDRIEAIGLELLAGPGDRVVRTASCTVHDPLDDLPHGSAGVLLAVATGELEAAGVIRAAAEAGFDAIVLRGIAVPPEAAELADEIGIAVLGVGAAVAWLQVERVVASVLTGSSRSGDGGSGTDLFGFANSVASILGGAVALEDLGRRVLAYSTVEGQMIDPDRQASILGRHVPVRAESDDRYSAVLASTAPVVFPGAGEVMGRMAVAIRLGDDVLGTMWVLDEGERLDEDAPLMLQRAAELAAVHLLQSRTAAAFESERRSALVRAVIRGGPEARVATDRLGLAPTGPFVVLAFVGEVERAVGSQDDNDARRALVGSRWQRFMTMVDGYAAGWIPAVGVDVEHGVVHVLLHGDTARDLARVSINAHVLIDRAAAWGLDVTAGVGSAVDIPERVHDSREEAYALAQLAGEAGGAAVLDADRDHGTLTLWWLQILAQERPSALSPSVLRLQEHDARHGTDFLGTWAAWFDHGMDTGRAAAAVNVHPNTLRYRLRRAAAISGLTDRPDDLLVAWLTVRLLTRTGQGRPFVPAARPSH